MLNHNLWDWERQQGASERDSKLVFTRIQLWLVQSIVLFMRYLGIVWGWSSWSHSSVEIKGFDLGNLNPIYERVLTSQMHQTKGIWNVSMCSEGGEGCQHREQQGGDGAPWTPTVGSLSRERGVNAEHDFLERCGGLVSTGIEPSYQIPEGRASKLGCTRAPKPKGKRTPA